MRTAIAAACLFAVAFPVAAAEITIVLPGVSEVQRSEAVYTCGDRQIPVEYINAGRVSLAVLKFGDETIVATNVIAASGAKYAGAQYIWWTKGDDAFLYDLMQSEGDSPVNCSTAAK